MKTIRYIFLASALSCITYTTCAQTSSKKALILGITGQDGSYLAELLLDKGYEVHGSLRPSSNSTLVKLLLSKNPGKLFLHYGDITNRTYIKDLIATITPDEVYNLAAQSNVGTSFKLPYDTAQANGFSVLAILESIHALAPTKKIKFYQASTGEMYGNTNQALQNEKTLFNPQSPYAIAKLYAHLMTRFYRETHGMFACNGILFNHESPRRGEGFVTHKITRAAAARAQGKKEIVYLGNLNAQRDWGYAPEYVESMWLALQHKVPDDYVVATGTSHSIREFVEKAYGAININIQWKGKGLDEIGTDKKTGEVLVKVDPEFFRPIEQACLRGDCSKARKKLGWKPKTTFNQLVKIMVDADIQLYKDHSHASH